jgi:hypothetical protein
MGVTQLFFELNYCKTDKISASMCSWAVMSMCSYAHAERADDMRSWAVMCMCSYAHRIVSDIVVRV